MNNKKVEKMAEQAVKSISNDMGGVFRDALEKLRNADFDGAAQAMATNINWYGRIDAKLNLPSSYNFDEFFTNAILYAGVNSNKKVKSITFLTDKFVKKNEESDEDACYRIYDEIHKYLIANNVKLLYEPEESDSQCAHKTGMYFGINSFAVLKNWQTSNNDFKIRMSLVSFDEEIYKTLKDFCKGRLLEEDKKSNLYLVTEDDGSLQLQTCGRPGVKLERENYDEKVLKNYDLVVEQLSKEDPFGRLAIFRGVPGTGKTYMIRSLINDVVLEDCKWVFVPPDLLSFSTTKLTKLFIDHANEHEKLIIIIEDADDCLLTRDEKFRSSTTNISKILNIADGMIGQLLDLRVIATTNGKDVEIDPALKRSGRLISMVDVEMISVKQAAKIYKRLTGEDREFGGKNMQSIILADVYAAADVHRRNIEQVEASAEK